MNLTSEALVQDTTFGVPSGNYDGSSLDFFSPAGLAANYYQGNGSIQTIIIQVTAFRGQIHLEATLNDNPESAAWFRIYDYDHRITPITETHPVTITGNFSYIRASIKFFEDGTINQITVTY